MNEIFKRLQKGILLLDGAMGSALQQKFPQPGICLEELNLTRPDSVLDEHRGFIESGVHIIETNTLGANEIKLEQYGLGGKVEEINKRGVRLAREAASDKCMVALSVGATGKFLEPLGDLAFQRALDVYRRQIGSAVEEGIDMVVIETISDLKEIRAAMIAAKEFNSLPVMATMTFQEDGRTLLGTPPEVAAVCLESLGADIIGANCGTGPHSMLPVLKRLRRSTLAHLAVQSNAGMPRLERGRTVFPATPGEMAGYYIDFVKEGVGVLGGCCGSTPRHMQAIAKAVASIKPDAPPRVSGLALCSRSRVVRMGTGHLPVKIGERINPTGRKTLSAQLTRGEMDGLVREAREQVEAGADLLDVNVGVPGVDEAGLISSAMLAVQQNVAVPLVLDSSDPAAIEAGLKAADGKVLINSISGEEEKLERILPLAVKYGASVIGLTLDDNGIPPKASQRLQVAQRILDAVLKAGMSKENLVIDCLTLAASVEQELVMETLLAIELIKKELDLPVVLGVSNVSFGLPRRKLITSSFLAMAIASGLDGAILNPKDARMLESLHSASVLAGRDYRALKYMELYGNASSEDTPVQEDTQTSSPRRKLFQAVVGGHEEEIPSLVEAVLQDGIKPMEISNSILIPALEKVGEQFNSKDFFLPQVMLSAESAKIAFDRVKGELEGEETISRGKIIMATVQGDIHDIGKNIVSMLLENHGYQILDLGVNVPAEKIITLAEEEDVDIIGLSALMTTTMREMSRSVESIKHKGIKCPVMVGGAAVTREYALEIGADGYGKDAVEAVELVNKLLLVKN